MLSKKHRIKKKKEFENVFKKGKSFAESFLIIKVISNEFSFSRFAFISPSKIFKKAVERNKIKRLIRRVVESNNVFIKEGFDIILIARKEIIKKEYKEIESGTLNLFKKADIIKIDK